MNNNQLKIINFLQSNLTDTTKKIFESYRQYVKQIDKSKIDYNESPHKSDFIKFCYEMIQKCTIVNNLYAAQGKHDFLVFDAAHSDVVEDVLDDCLNDNVHIYEMTTPFQKSLYKVYRYLWFNADTCNKNILYNPINQHYYIYLQTDINNVQDEKQYQKITKVLNNQLFLDNPDDDQAFNQNIFPLMTKQMTYYNNNNNANFIENTNNQIKNYHKSGNSVKGISDGHHSFNDLYDQRAKLVSIIANTYNNLTWRSWQHNDGSMFDGDFIVGFNTLKGQYSFHFKSRYWDLFERTPILDKAPHYDGHKPNDINRLLSIIQ